jgi:hypothetical protein
MTPVTGIRSKGVTCTSASLVKSTDQSSLASSLIADVAQKQVLLVPKRISLADVDVEGTTHGLSDITHSPRYNAVGAPNASMNQEDDQVDLQTLGLDQFLSKIPRLTPTPIKKSISCNSSSVVQPVFAASSDRSNVENLRCLSQNASICHSINTDTDLLGNQHLHATTNDKSLHEPLISRFQSMQIKMGDEIVTDIRTLI